LENIKFTLQTLASKLSPHARLIAIAVCSFSMIAAVALPETRWARAAFVAIPSFGFGIPGAPDAMLGRSVLAATVRSSASFLTLFETDVGLEAFSAVRAATGLPRLLPALALGSFHPELIVFYLGGRFALPVPLSPPTLMVPVHRQTGEKGPDSNRPAQASSASWKLARF
jgi:hypothetical protein